ncbi:phage tail protein [Pseudomonas citronellolis]|uniref:phage tail-collar fiber domain-containing protein n=1 Tax=Pseudomonas citronellolis TaxID=53408 RepID=UPI0023E3EA46|nr:phage tail protein [Pseudomonas citronellolis]MDF3932309.1 phage tail protein [Pseudomonas citronellolis]
MAVTYYALLTTLGAGKLANAAALGTTLKITQLAVGDGGGSTPTPDASRTALVNEVRRAPLNQLSVDPANAAQIIAEQVIPEDVGGWWIRELGLYDDSGTLIAYANCAPSYKPQLAEGSGRTQTVRLVLIVSNTASVELKIDPSVVLASREYVDGAIVSAINRLDYKQSVRVATTANITLGGLQVVDGVALAAGDRVLVKNQTTASQNGLYVAAAGAWARASDADSSLEVTSALVVVVETGTSLADTIWQLITDAPISLGTTALVFQDITNGLARLFSPAFTGVPAAPTAAVGTNTTQLATTAFVTAATYSKSAIDSALQPLISAEAVSQLLVGYQAKLGYAPVQMGTGVGQTNNVVKLGWDGANLRLTIDATDMGSVWTEANNSIPGAIVYFARSTAPSGYLKANGAAVSRATYAKLFAAIGTAFGAGDGSTTFNLPDLRGEFIRGFDDGRGVDSGRLMGSAQSWALENITGVAGVVHGLSMSGAFYDGGPLGTLQGGSSGLRYSNFDASRVVQTASETRPRNVALLACIKY